MRLRFLFIFLSIVLRFSAQLSDIKIIIPKDPGYAYGDFVTFFPDEKHFVTCAGSLCIYNTETAEALDEAELPFAAKNLSVSNDGRYILLSAGSEMMVYTFDDQQLRLSFKTTTAELIKNVPNAQYYGALPIAGCFFTKKPGEIYVSIGSFTLLYDMNKKATISSHAFPVTDFILHSVYYPKQNEALLAKMNGTVTTLVKQSLDKLDQISDFMTDKGSYTKIRVHDSLLFCYTSNKFHITDLTNGKVLYEVRMAKYESYGLTDKATQAMINERPALSVPDTINFKKDEYVYDMDYFPGTPQAAFSTSKGFKVIDMRTRKVVRSSPNIVYSFRFSNTAKRMVSNSYTPYRALRVFEPGTLKLIAERPVMGTIISSAEISPNKRWLYTNGGTSGFLWDLSNFSKYVEIKDPSGSDTAYIYHVFFLNDSELVVNSGKSFGQLNLSIYNFHKKRYMRTLKKNVFAASAGFLNGEFYYADYTSLHIINLKTLAEERYEGLFSLAASDLFQVINFTKQHVFIPESGKFKIVNRLSKKVEYESGTWSMNTNVLISPDGKCIYTSAQINKKKSINGVEVELPTNAIVKIDLAKKEIVHDFAQTYYPYDCRLKDNGKTIGIWYLKYDVGSVNPEEKETVYSEYDTETGAELLHKTLTKTTDLISGHYASATGKYFSLLNPINSCFKVFDAKGNELIDLSETRIQLPKCFFIEELEKLIVVSPVNSLATFVDLKQKKVIGQLANASSDNFFLITSDLYYIGSKEFVKNIRFRYSSELYSFEQFDAYLNQPHRVLRAFGCSDSALIQAYETAYLKRMRVLGLSPNDKINFSSLPALAQVQMREEKAGQVNFSLSANKGGSPLAKLDVYNNGTLVFSEAIAEAQGARYEKSLSLETSSGLNRFEFIVKDAKGLESPRTVRLYNNLSDVKPNLYLVVIGSEQFRNSKFDLSYAVKDAGDVANAMVNSPAFGKVQLRRMFNKSFSTDSVKHLKDFLSPATINDVVMVFFAGHGYLDEDLSYYFPTYYTDFSEPKINSVAYKEFEKLFKEIKPTHKLMFIDACFSGEVDEDIYKTEEGQDGNKDKRAARVSGTVFAQSTALELSKAVFSDLRQNTGATIISSAGGTEAAYEGEKWNNGLFTHCLLEGLQKQKADLNADKKISLAELQKYVSEEVNQLSGGKQTPTYRVENSVLDYELW